MASDEGNSRISPSNHLTRALIADLLLLLNPNYEDGP
jgi:hypothetical protein